MRLLGFLAAVFVLKLIVVAELYDHPLLQPDTGLDTSAYAALAGRVRGGDLLLGPGLYFVSPFYIYFLAAALAMFRSFTAVRVLQVALGTAAVGLIFVAAREWFGRRAAWIAATAAAFTGLFTFYEALLLQSAVDPVLTAAALAGLALALARRDRSVGWFVAAGFAFGLETLNRPNAGVAVAVTLVLLLLIRCVRGTSLLAAGLTLALGPMLARNVAVAGVWSPLPSHGGLNLYIGNNPEADGTFHSVAGITPNIAGQQADVRRVASEALGHKVTDAEASGYFRNRAFDWMRAHTGAALRLFARKLAYTFNAAHIPLNDSYTFYASDARTLLRLLIVGAWALIPLGLTGLVLGAQRERLAPYVVWVSFVPAYAVSVAMFFASDRYRLPLLVPMCIGTGAAADWIASLKGSRYILKSWRYAGLCAALFVFTNWPLGLEDGRIEERTRMAEQFAVQGRAGEADRWAARAEAGNPEPAIVHFRVGRALFASHQTNGAVRHLERALQLDPGRPETEYALGQALLDAGRPGDAVPHLRKAVDVGVRSDVAGFDLARALTAIGDLAAATQALAHVTPANPRDAASWLALGELAIQLDAPDLEEKFFNAAVAAAPANATAHLNLAVTYAQQGRVDDARIHAQEAVKLKPDYEKARQLLAALDRQRP